MTPSEPSSAEPVERLLSVVSAPAELRQRVLDMPRAELEAAIGALGHRREPAAATTLAAIDQLAADKSVRKAARRELHRLEGVGIHAPTSSVLPVEALPSAPTAPAVVAREGWASEYDYTGARALWLLGDRRDLGGSWVAAFVLHDTQGITSVDLYDSTRKRFVRELERMQRERPDSPWSELPLPYALALVRESADLTRERGKALPSAYRRFVDMFGEPSRPPERALVYDIVSPLEVRLHPEWLAESARLVIYPEVGGWMVEAGPALRQRALGVARSTSSALLVPGNSPVEQAARLLDDAVREYLTPEQRHGLRRRLEETAYLFVRSDRLDAARRAVAAAQALEDPSLSPIDHSLVRTLVGAGLAASIRGEQVGGESAPDVLLNLLGELEDQPDDGPSPGPLSQSGPGGLILPR